MESNTPQLWRNYFPVPEKHMHKYDRGHALLVGADMWHTGATRLAATATMRMGAGLVSVACNIATLPFYAASLPMAVMTAHMETVEDLETLLVDPRKNAVLVGPGNGVGDTTRQQTLAVLQANKRTVLDADALTCFASSPKLLFSHITSECILTPHAAEFSRLFGAAGVAVGGDRLSAIVQAASLSKAVVVLKGYETLIASPRGQVVVNRNAPPWLATAGSGDVLAGLCLGLLAQGMPLFEAACAAVWLHGAAGERIGPGLIADDLPHQIPCVIQKILTV